MTRFEVNFLLMLAASACTMVSAKPFGATLFGLLAMWFCLRAMFPSLDQWCRDE